MHIRMHGCTHTRTHAHTHTRTPTHTHTRTLRMHRSLNGHAHMDQDEQLGQVHILEKALYRAFTYEAPVLGN